VNHDIASLSNHSAQAFALGADHQDAPPRAWLEVANVDIRARVEADDFHAGLRKRKKGSLKIGHLGDRRMLGGSGRRPDDGGRDSRRAMLWNDQAIQPEGHRTPNDGA